MITDDNGNFFERVEAGPWLGLVPAEVTKLASPRHRWQGERIPLDLVRQVTSFFEWSLKETGGETVVHLYYHEDEGDWRAVVLPQKGHTGMSVSLLPDHPGRLAAVEALGPGYDLASTWHHHCQGAAFQSGTDAADERDVFGLHVTIGNVGGPRYSIDARCSFKKHFTPAVLADWVSLPQEYASLPAEVQDLIVPYMVCQPEPAAAFPEEWKANVIKVAPAHGGGWIIPGSTQRQSWQQQGLGFSARHELRELAQLWSMNHAQMLEWVGRCAKNDLLRELADVMVDNHLDFDDVTGFYEEEAELAAEDKDELAKAEEDEEYEKLWKEHQDRDDPTREGFGY